MGKIFDFKIDQFDYGVTNNLRLPDQRYAQTIKHFDVLTKRNALIPYRDHEDGSSGGDTDKLSKFLFYNGKTYALGVVSGSSKVKIFEMSTFSGNTWSATANGEDGGGTRDETVFVEYKGYGYGFAASSRIWKADLSGSAAFVSTDLSISATATTTAQGLVHSKDDILYIAYNNIIAKKNGATWTDSALTLPTNTIITALSEYGNYLAIATRSSSGVGNSTVYLWDRDGSLTTVSEKIDWGAGDLYVLEEIEGQLVGVSTVGSSTSAFVPKIVFRAYTGAGAHIFKELQSSTAPTVKGKQKVNSRLFFLMSATLNGTLLEGVWSIGKNTEGHLSLSLDRLPNNDTALTSGILKGFALIGDYMFIAYVSNGSYAASKTNDQSSYTATSIYETLIQSASDPSIKKKLVGISVFYEPLPAAGSVVLKYKADAESSFTQIFSDGTDNAISHSAINIESTGANLPEFKEIQFRLESTGGAVITGIKYRCELLDKDIY